VIGEMRYLRLLVRGAVRREVEHRCGEIGGAMVQTPEAGNRRAAERNVLGVSEYESSGESSSEDAGKGESVACPGIAGH
jgi:hypothetical protein